MARRWTRSISDRNSLVVGHDAWTHTASMIDWLCEHWDQAEDGIWETRGGRKDFVYGKLMCWVAFDRAIRIAAGGQPLVAAGSGSGPSRTTVT